MWSNESLQLYAKRGEAQDGVDIVDPLCLKPVRAVQCKFHEPAKTIPPSEIKAEVARAEKSHFAIEHYVIATTAKKSRQAQDTVAELNQRPNRQFTVEIHFWEEICQHAGDCGRVMAEFIVYGENILAGSGGAAQGAAGSMASWSRPESGDGTGPYAAIEKLLDERRLDVARHELDKLPSGAAAGALPPGERYMLLRLRAKLDMECGAFETAARLFLEAYAVSPELDQAKQNEVLALALLNEPGKAYARATEYIAQGLTTPVMVLRLIDSIASREQLDQHATAIDGCAATDENINTALCHKYLVFGDYERARTAAERALRIVPDSPHAHLAAAMSIHTASVHAGPRQRMAGLRKALEHYDAAEVAARAQRFGLLLPEILVNRAAARALTADIAGAASDFRAAVSCSTQPAVYAAAAIGFFLHEQDYDGAWELLDRLDRTTNESKYLVLVTEHHTGDETDKRRYIDEMEWLARQDWPRAAECRFQCVQWAIELKEYERAASFVTASFQEEYPFQAHVMLAWINAESGSRERAKEEAAKALDQSVKSAHPQELRLLAHILVKLKDDAKAVGLLEQVARPGVFDDDMKMLITCAQRLDRHDLLLRLCRELREAGVEEDRLRQQELQLLNRYAPREALQLAEEFAGTSASPAYFVAFRNMVAVRLNELDKVTLEASALPTPAELLPEEANLMLLPFVATGHYAEALKFLYAQRRLNFEDEHAHGRYIFFFLTYGHHTLLQEPPATAGPDCAVLLDLDGGEQRWVVIEDEQPVASRDEFAASSPIGNAIAGQKPGSIITLPGKLVQPQAATLREIQTKYVRAFQDGMQNFAKRFPGTTILQQFHVGDGDQFDPTVFIETLKGRREHIDTCVEVYRDQPCSLYLFADHVGVTELEAIKALIRHPKGIVKCSEATPEPFARAVQDGIAPKAIVLSMSAIITLTLVDGWQFLDSERQYLVSQMTGELLDGWIQSCAENFNEGAGSTTIDDSGNGNNGTITGATYSTTVPGAISPDSNSVSFNGTSSYVTLGSGLATLTYPYTVSMWVNAANLTQNGVVLNLYANNSSAKAGIGIWGTGGYIIASNNATNQATIPTLDFSAGVFQHWAIVYTSANNFSFYLNGVPLSATSPADHFNINGVDEIGNGGFGNIRPFSGSVDDVRVYNTTLSAQDVKNLYAGIPQWSVGTASITATNNITTDIMGTTLTAGAGKNITMTAGGSIINNSVGTVSASQSAGSGGNVTLIANALNFAANPTISTNGTVTIEPDTASTTIGVAGGAGSLAITSAVLGDITAGEVDIGATGDTGLLTANAYTWGENVKFFGGSGGIAINGVQTMGGNSLFAQTASTGDITIGASGGVSSTATGTPITLVSNHNLINNGGSSALSDGSGRWLVYSTNPSNDTDGSLSNSLRRFSCTYGGSCPSFPSTGNGFLYSYTPTLTITPNSQSITYGDAAPNLTGYGYSVLGYLGSDSGSDSLSGSLTGSTNYAQYANHGSYNINYSSGSLASAMGYGFSYANNTGGLTVNAKGLTVTADSKSMNAGGTVPTLTYSYTGLVGGDASASFSGALATSGTSSSPAGTYAVTSGTLAASGNYTIGTFNAGVFTINSVAPAISTADISRILQQPRFIVDNQSLMQAPVELVSLAGGESGATPPAIAPASPTVTGNSSSPKHLRQDRECDGKPCETD